MFRFACIVLVMAAALFASAPTVSSGVNYEVTGDVNTISSSAAFDTLVATDSALILSAFTQKPGLETILAVGPITGTGADSVLLYVYADCYDPSGNIILRKSLDTISSSGGVCAGKEISMLFPPATKYDVKLVGVSGNGGQVILNRMYVYFRKILTFTK